MALSDYSELQTEAIDWMERSGQAAKAPVWIQLAESRLNRELGVVETDAALIGTVASRSIDISSLAMVQPIALFIAEVGCDEEMLTPKADGTFEYRSDVGRPSFWAIDGTNIDFDCPLSTAYPFRFRYRQRFALATSNTNWLLTNHPDLYLAATLMWGAGYNQDWPNGAAWKQMLDEGIPQVKNQIAQTKRATATVDAALTYPGRSWRYGWDGR